MMDKANGKIVVLGLIVVVLALWVNSMLGYQGDIPVESEQMVVEYTE